MKKLLVFMLLSVIVLTTNSFAQDHIIVTEFVVTPTDGEFIEIYNPTSDSVDLSHHYVTDAISSNDNHYTTIVQGGFAVQNAFDFMAQFPAGTKIGPGQHITIAFSGTGFTSEYSSTADFEIIGDDAATPDMTPVDVGGSAGLSNSGEAIILFYWDGVSDLVMDVDIIVWGDQNEAVDKTGLSIDGIDTDSDASTYANDTPVANQYVVNTENDGDPEPHDFGNSAQRRLNVEDVENWSANGNGLTGHDETSENTSWLSGGIWSINEPATPGYRALGMKSASDSLTIADIQFLRADSVGAAANDDSPFEGDTLTVTGVVMNDIRAINLGARWGSFISDVRGGPWSGFFVIQNDSTVGGTQFNAALPGDKIKMTGVMEEFPANTSQSITEVSLFFNPAVPIEILDSGLPLPDPILLTPGDIGATGSSENPRLTERLESTLVRFENLTVMSNSPGQAGNIMTAGDETGTIAIDDYFFVLRDMLDNQTNGEWPGFPVGTVINITGFMRDVQTGGAGRTTINPRSLDDIEIASAPPSISSNITRDPVVVSSSDSPTISTVIESATSTVASAEINYRVDGGDFQQVAMTASDSLYSGSIPAQADGAFIEYYISATDAGGLSSTNPGDIESSLFFYFVRDAGLSIFDLQFTPFDDGNSSYRGLEVTVSGIATTDSADFSFYFIQDGTDPWNGIWVQDNVNNVKLGDSVTVTGTVEEQFNATRINDVTNATIHSSGNSVPEPIVLTTGELGPDLPTTEPWEGMLVRAENVRVSNPFADAPSNFGEFEIDDGSGPVRVDDLGNFRGNLDSTFAEGDSLLSVTGIQHYTFGDFKIEPRNDNDVIRFATSVDTDEPVPFTFELSQNYPNPFNPETTIRYQVARPSDVKIQIYNILGQRVTTLVDAFQPRGAYTIQWRGTNDQGVPVSTGVYIYHMKAGDFVQVKKMLFLK